MALAFGMIFNLLVRRFVGADEVEGWNVAALKAKARGRVMALLDKVLGKGKGKEKEKNVQ